MKQLVQLRDIVVRRSKFTLRIDHLDLQRGKLYLLTGPNGAGKSTLLQLLAQLLVPHCGEVYFDHRLVANYKERQKLRRQITLVEQKPFLFEGTIYQSLAFGLKLRNIKGESQRQRIREALATVGLEEFESRRTDSLSGGETQRVALARALALRPTLLLLDEASAGLDAAVMPFFERLITELPGHGMTIILSSHDREQPTRLGATILALCNGNLQPAAIPALECSPVLS